MRKSRRKKSKGTFIILATSIAVLNFLGISYAGWNEGLQITASVRTGNMDVEFSNAFLEIVGEGSFKDSSIEITNNSKVLNVFGTVLLEYDQEVPEVVLNYAIRNSGSVPVSSNGGVLSPMESSENNCLNLDAGNDSNHSSIELMFKQN